MLSSTHRTALLSFAVPALAGWLLAACVVVHDPNTPVNQGRSRPQTTAEPGSGSNNTTPPNPSTPTPEAAPPPSTGHVPSVPDGALNPPTRVPADPHVTPPGTSDPGKDPGKPPPDGPRVAVPKIPVTTINRADGSACSAGDQCASGICEGLGCRTDEGTCMPRQRACTRDLRPFCGCDGVTFSASGSCPGRVFLHPGPCKQPR